MAIRPNITGAWPQADAIIQRSEPFSFVMTSDNLSRRSGKDPGARRTRLAYQLGGCHA